MFNQFHYVPILKWKRGEQIGLLNCTDEVKKCLTPLIEIQPVPWDFNKECPSQTVDTHIDDISDSIYKTWGTGKPFFIDVSLVDPELLENGKHIISKIFSDSIDKNLNIIPVISLVSSNEFNLAIKEILKKENNNPLR